MASSHNRLLYFQRMLEMLDLNPLQHAMTLYNTYWDTFLDNMQVYEGVQELLTRYSGKICFLTDLTVHIQYRKVEALNLLAYSSKIVTSEEAGREKPHPYMFMLGLQKLNMSGNEVCMIGDNFKKDIKGASNLGIPSIWINHKQVQESYDAELVTEVH
jgi:putative hydrolase of the HAD superfamily